MSTKDYAGKEVVITYDAQRCIHAKECVRGLPTVFDPDARPWIAPDQGTADEVATVVQRCPTGALTLRRADGSTVELVGPVNTVAIQRDGPLYLRGRVLYSGGTHAALAEYTRVALCRCGASANKPFCDGSHEKVGFRDAGAIGARDKDRPAAECPAAPGAVTLKPINEGPLMVEGWVEFKAADGSTFVAGDKMWLCRCGRSQSKPFCDGSHKALYPPRRDG